MTSINSAIPKTASTPIAFPFRLKDRVSALTHFIGFLAAIFSTPPLLIRAAALGNTTERMVCFSIFLLSMILLYGASASYHAFDISEKANRILRKIDHMMIFVLIAGTYTPYCAIAVGGDKGRAIFALQWGITLIGCLITLFWVNVPKWLCAVIYIAMGWVCLLAMPDFVSGLNAGSFGWLLTGGILYTLGGIIYALKLKFLTRPGFGAHELFHLFVMAGSICHYISMLFMLTLPS